MLLASIAALSESELGAVQQALFESMVAPPLVARPISRRPRGAKEEAHVISAKAVAALSEGELGAVQLCRVRGDGHCLFRAIGASLILGAVWGSRDRVNSLSREHLAACAAAEPAARRGGGARGGARRGGQREPAAGPLRRAERRP